MKWRICGDCDPDGPVREGDSDRAQNRAKFEVWKYNFLGPGKDIYNREYALQIVESGVLSKEPVHIRDPWYTAAVASVIAEMEGHEKIAMLIPSAMPRDEQQALEKIAREENQAIDRVADYYKLSKTYIKDMLEKLEQHNN